MCHSGCAAAGHAAILLLACTIPLLNNLRLQDMRAEDVPALFKYQLEPAARHMAAFVAKNSTDRNAFAESWKKNLADESMTINSLMLDGHVVGMIASFERNDLREVTYWIGQDYWDRGIATCALGRFLQGFATRPLYARAAKDNVASNRVLTKNGFTLAGEEQTFANARDEEIEELVYVLE